MAQSQQPYIMLYITFDDGDRKELTMPIDAYHRMKEAIRQDRRPGSEATIQLAIGDDNGEIGGEILIPWAKVKCCEAFVRGDLNSGSVAQSLLQGVAPEKPAG